MVLPIVAAVATTCVPCIAAGTTFSSSAAAATGALGLTGAAVVKTFKKRSKKCLKKCKDKKKKKSDNKKDKKKKTKKKKPIKGGGNSLKKEEKKIFKELHLCNQKCSKKMNTDNKKPRTRTFRFKHPNKRFNKDWQNPIIEMNTKEKIIRAKKWKERTKCRKLCSKSQQKKLKTHKKKFSKEYRVINKENQKKCCRCKYIKQNNKYFKVRGSYGHCAYDMTNCCKDKKTILPKTK